MMTVRYLAALLQLSNDYSRINLMSLGKTGDRRARKVRLTFLMKLSICS